MKKDIFFKILSSFGMELCIYYSILTRRFQHICEKAVHEALLFAVFERHVFYLVDKQDSFWYNNYVYDFLWRRFSVNSINDLKTEAKKTFPSKVSLVVAAVLSCLFALGAALALGAFDFVTSAIMFIGASAVFSFFLIFVRHYLSMAIPVISAVVSMLFGCDILLALAVCCSVTVFAAMYTVCHMRLMESFWQFTVTALAYSVAGGALFCFILYYVYGSLGGGIVALGNKIASLTPVLAETASSMGTDYDMALYVFGELLGMATVYIPAIIFALGVMSAWLMRGFFSLYTRLSGLSSLFGGRQTSAPKALAVIFLVTSLLGVLFAVLPDGVFYGVSNVRSILSVIFFGEGIRLFFASFNRRARRRAGAGSVIGACVLLFFFPFMLPVILPYYGAICVLLAPGMKKAEK